MPAILLLRSIIKPNLKSLQSQVIRRNLINNAARRPTRIPGERKRNIVLYSTAGVLFTIAMTYAAVPLYRLYCLKTGLGGRAEAADEDKVKRMKKVEDRKLTIIFQADTQSSLAWNFKPLQHEIIVAPGETALAFYTARNPLKEAVTGVATYNVMPFEAGLYLNKIQCFCFEEQRLNPDEQVSILPLKTISQTDSFSFSKFQVDMPVFFFIDPEYAADPRLDTIDTIVLNYVFYPSKEGIDLPFLQQIYDKMEGNETVKKTG